MSPRYLRVPPTRRNEVTAALIAGALAAAVGLVTFYVSRLLLSRSPLAEPDTDPGMNPEGS